MGPLQGVKIIELAGIGPGPFAAMMLSDMGADVIRVDRSSAVRGDDIQNPPPDPLARGRRSLGVDLKNPDGVETVLKLVEQADVIMEGFRPGVAERLGLGPDVCLARNPKIVYGRMTGWGQEGPYASAAGHDLNYIALAGALESIGRAGDKPCVPLNLVGDFGGGGMYLAFGIACALFESQRSGQGQVIDAAMVDGAASLMNMFWGLKAIGIWGSERGTNMLDSGAPFYDVYECADGKFVSIGSIEPQFYAELLRLSGLGDVDGFDQQMNKAEWPAMKERVAEIFKAKTRDQWCEIMEHTDVCFAPVLSMEEATEHPHMVARGTFTKVGGMTQAGPAPRFSRTEAEIQRPAAHPGQHSDEVLASFGFAPAQIAELRDSGAIA